MTASWAPLLGWGVCPELHGVGALLRLVVLGGSRALVRGVVAAGGCEGGDDSSGDEDGGGGGERGGRGVDEGVRAAVVRVSPTGPSAVRLVGAGAEEGDGGPGLGGHLGGRPVRVGLIPLR